jgi:hypothetical protein
MYILRDDKKINVTLKMIKEEAEKEGYVIKYDGCGIYLVYKLGKDSMNLTCEYFVRKSNKQGLFNFFYLGNDYGTY